MYSHLPPDATATIPSHGPQKEEKQYLNLN